ncbi:MAG: hypothetical protein GY870_14330, partial [archaeon]|nr:hypothetical protein [archaeon]
TDSSIPEESQIVVEHIVWNSIPAVEEMTRVKVKNGANIILETALDQNSTLSEWNLADNGALNYTNSGYVMFFSFEILDGNLAIPLWPYFNYLIYISTFHVHPDVIDEQILSFALWPYSPIPHLIEIIMWFTMITFLWIISFIFYFRAKKTSRHYSEYYTNKSINIMEGNSDGK